MFVVKGQKLVHTFHQVKIFVKHLLRIELGLVCCLVFSSLAEGGVKVTQRQEAIYVGTD